MRHWSNRSPTAGIVLRLPPLLRGALAAALRAAGRPGELGTLLQATSAEAPGLLSEWLQPLRQQQPSARLTSGRIARAFAVEVFAVAGQELMVHALTGTEEYVPPVATYCVALDVDRLAQATQQAWAKLFGDEGRPIDREGHSIGAPFCSGPRWSAGWGLGASWWPQPQR